MAVSAFKSTSRRGNLATSTAPAAATAGSRRTKKADSGESSRKPRAPPARRSRSVSAFSRNRADSELDLDFGNKRDNPLFWAADSPPPDGNSAAKTIKSDQVGSRVKSSGSSWSRLSGSGGERKGRTVSRDSGSAEGKSVPIAGAAGRSCRGVGRSLSRGDSGRSRRRWVSRGYYGNDSENQECSSMLVRGKSKSDVKGDAEEDDEELITRSNSDLAELLECWRTETDDGSISEECSLFIPPQWEGESIMRMRSFSDAEERSYRLSYPEITNLMRRFSGGGIRRGGENEGNGTVESDETEAIVGITEFARKLEESEERARQLRAELAIEEQRGDELNKILQEIVIPYEETECPVDVDVMKPGAVRKASMDRRKVSRQLEEEALAFFDECVSISTFEEESELSSFEDPSALVGDKVGSGTPVGNNLAGGVSPYTAEARGGGSEWKKRGQFSLLDRRRNGSSELVQEIKTYVKAFAKGGSISSNSRSGEKETTRGRATGGVKDAEHVPGEMMLIERMSVMNRIESGGLLLCCGCNSSREFGFPFLL